MIKPDKSNFPKGLVFIRNPVYDDILLVLGVDTEYVHWYGSKVGYEELLESYYISLDNCKTWLSVKKLYKPSLALTV